MIRTENLTKDYGSGRGIRKINMHVPKGAIFGFVGPNGAGKTTTIRILCGLIRADSGKAYVNGMEVKPSNYTKIKKTIGFLPDEFGVYDQMSVWEYLDFFGAAYRIPPKERKKRIEEVLEICDASHMIDYQVNSLSRGMHQKIGICKTLLHDPLLLILDEPANGLDPYARIEMRETILRLKDMGKTILISSHILPELGTMCDHVGIIEKGQLLIQGTLEEITHNLQQNLVLEIQVDSPVKDAIELLRQYPGVKDVQGSLHEIRIEYVGKRNEIADLTSYLVQNGVRLMSIKEGEVDLENVFLTVTGKDRKAPAKSPAKPVVKAHDPE
ncbi:MAG: ABC transporter ATP-binding protein, partial [Lentisphaerae bacterium]